MRPPTFTQGKQSSTVPYDQANHKFCFSFQPKNKTNNKLKEKITWSRKKMKNAPQTPLHPFCKNPSMQKMPKIVKCTFFHQPIQLWKSFLGMLTKNKFTWWNWHKVFLPCQGTRLENMQV